MEISGLEDLSRVWEGSGGGAILEEDEEEESP